MEKIDTAERAPDLPNAQNEDPVNYWEKNTCDQANNRTDSISGIEGNKVSAISGMYCHHCFSSAVVITIYAVQGIRF